MYSTVKMAKSNSEEFSHSSQPKSWARDIDAALTEWFRHNQRDLVFRKTTDPYAIMVSEFMLQQTTVAAVIPYYERFLKKYPTVQSLANASEDEVMAIWSGLGYYRRARQLRLAAQAIVDHYSGQFPADLVQLKKLPGFGAYTAGAVLSSAYDIPAPILEANTVRVFARLTAKDGTVGVGSFMNALWQTSEFLVRHAQSPRQFNVAAMELGALICRPVPQCPECPVQSSCIGYRIGVAERIPQIKPRPPRQLITLGCLILQSPTGQYLLRRIPKGEWHEGMWEFPSWRFDDSPPTAQEIKKRFTADFNLHCSDVVPLHTFRYTVTHHAITSHAYLGQLNDENTSNVELSEVYRFFDHSAISDLAMSSPQRKLFNRLSELQSRDNME